MKSLSVSLAYIANATTYRMTWRRDRLTLSDITGTQDFVAGVRPVADRRLLT